ncbi:MAG: hypothetical protein PVSMB7_21770 [Chloroflexota bacterium]
MPEIQMTAAAAMKMPTRTRSGSEAKIGGLHEKGRGPPTRQAASPGFVLYSEDPMLVRDPR